MEEINCKNLNQKNHAILLRLLTVDCSKNSRAHSPFQYIQSFHLYAIQRSYNFLLICSHDIVPFSWGGKAVLKEPNLQGYRRNALLQQQSEL